jgi:hypothetical protein
MHPSGSSFHFVLHLNSSSAVFYRLKAKHRGKSAPLFVLVLVEDGGGVREIILKL